MSWLIKILGKGNKRAGFTLVELMMVVIVVAILAAAAIPIYRFALARAYSSEGYATLGAIRSSELVEMAEGDEFVAVTKGTPTATTGIKAQLGVDTTNNTWWIEKCFWVMVNTDKDKFIAVADGNYGTDSKLKDVQIWLASDGSYGKKGEEDTVTWAVVWEATPSGW